MAAFIWGDAGAQMTPEAIAAQRKIAQAMIARGGDYSPIQSPWQGVARVAEGLMGGVDARMADAAERRNQSSEAALLASLIPGAAPSAPVAPAAVPAAPAAVAAPVAAAGDASLPRGIRNNNPLNIEAGTFTSSQPGFVGSDGRFARFETPEAGVAAASRLLDTYERKHGLNTVAGIIGRWAPTSDGNNVSAYAANVSRQLGIDPNAPIPPEMRPRLIAAMGQHENGRPINMGAAAPAAPVQAVAAAVGPNPNLLAAMASPYVSEGTKKVLGVILQTQLAGQKTETVDLGNKVAIMDQRGNVIREIPKGEPNKGPEYGVIRKDEFGNEVMGWRDPRDKSTTETKAPAATPAQPSTIPPAPPGVDPKVWRESQSRRAAEEGMPASGEATSKLRTEIRGQQTYKRIAVANPIYDSMLETAGQDDRAADLNLIYGFATVMDPDSVVRGEEMTMVKAIATIPEQLKSAVESTLQGSGRLSPQVREALLRQAHSRVKAYRGQFDNDVKQYRGIAQRNRMNEEDVIPTFGPLGEFKAPSIAPPAAAVSPTQIDDLVKKYAR